MIMEGNIKILGMNYHLNIMAFSKWLL